ncbi:hypothetical protein [Fusibacter bizertensis]
MNRIIGISTSYDSDSSCAHDGNRLLPNLKGAKIVIRNCRGFYETIVFKS